MSGIGKGVTAASTGRILKDYGYRVTAVKIDPYLNVDAGTMNPTEHGEVFVTEDGLECDQDIGNYERFLGENIFRDNYMTSGLVYKTVIDKERNLGFNGKCVQIIPNVTDEIEKRLVAVANKTKSDFVIVEIGGTVGEYENLLFLETARIMKLRMPGKVLFMLTSYFPIPKMVGEMKTKPTQHAVRALNYAGIQPEFIIARSSRPLDEVRKQKVSMFCNVDPRDVISAPDIEGSIYEIPINFERDNLGKRILEKYGLKPKKKNFREWKKMASSIRNSKEKVKIGIIGKYFGTGDFTLSDSYLSVIEAIKHASWKLGKHSEIDWLNAEQYERDPASVQELKKYDGLIIPGGFGKRGVEGKIRAIQFARENNIPFLGLCYGLQLAVIEFARNVCGLKNAHTTEVDKETTEPVITTMEDQKEKIEKHQMGGTMRLGSYNCNILTGSKAAGLYGEKKIKERHRHRYEVNNKYREILTKKGLIFSGINPEHNLAEIIELPNHKFFIASQFHPEFKSRPLAPHPLFIGFIKAASSDSSR